MDKLTEDRIKELREIKERILKGGGEKKQEAHRAKGKMTARDRINYLLDEGSFVEFNKMICYLEGDPCDGLINGYGTVNGRPICVYAQDATIRGGSVGMIHGFKMHMTVERAFNMRIPFVGLHDSPGARLPKLGESKSAVGDQMVKGGGSLFYPNTQGSGIIPQISAIMGSCAGLSVYSPALTDFIYMVDKQSHMYITGPVMSKTVTGEDLTHDQLGGADVHCKVSGVCDGRFGSDAELLDGIKDLLSYLPQNTDETSPEFDLGDDPNRMVDVLTDIVPSAPNVPYDVRDVITNIVDAGRFYEVKPEFAGEVVVGFGRMDKRVVGFVANNPMTYSGSMTVDSSDKQAKFMRLCDSFNIPIAMMIDTPAYMPGSDQEHRGMIRHGAKVLYALCESTVPRVCVVMRKAYGGGNLGMGLIPGMGTDLIYFWPTVEAGVLGATASVRLHFGKEIKKAEDPKEMFKIKMEEYSEKYSNPIREASGNWAIEDVIEPRETRKVLIQAFKYLATKDRTIKYPKRHGNIPL